MTRARTTAAQRQRQDARRAAARGEIVAAARRVALRNGIAGFTLEAVARETGVTKQGLLYHFASKDELISEVFFDEWSECARSIGDAVAGAGDGAAALEAIIRTYVERYAAELDVFRLVTQHGPTASPEELARFRPLNDVMYAEAERKLAADKRLGKLPKGADPRRLAFSAHLAAMGILAMKALVEGFGDPLRHSDRDLVDEMCRVFRAAAEKGK